MPSVKRAIDRVFGPVAERLDAGPGQPLGIRNTMHLARRYNRFLYARYQRFREQCYRARFDNLTQEHDDFNGPPPVRMQDGWALDTSGNLPYLEELLREADEVIEQRGEKLSPNDQYRSFFRHLTDIDDLRTWPSFLSFITSSQLLATVCDYLQFVPALTKTLPTGVRFVESGKHLDAKSHLPPRDSQLYHVDPYDHPMVYVIVLLRDCTSQSGPFTFLPRSISEQVSARHNYWSRGVPYRLSDDQVYEVADPRDAIRLTYPRGTVLFIDTSHCMHYGSRDCDVPRYQMMYGLSSICRCDFSESYIPPFDYPIQAIDSRLRKMVLDRRYIE